MAHRVKALWYGGSSYANPDPARDLENFGSLRQARHVFERRANFDPYYPCVDRDLTEMHVFFGEYTEDGPDRILRFGPRGGVRVERG